MDSFSRLVAAGLRTLAPDQRAHIVGHDWGGAVLWHLAARHADRVRTATVLSTPHPGALVWSLTRSRQALSSSYLAFFQLPQLPERLLAPRLRRFYRRTGLPAEHAERYAVRFAEPGSLTGPLGWYRSLPLRHWLPETHPHLVASEVLRRVDGG